MRLSPAVLLILILVSCSVAFLWQPLGAQNWSLQDTVVITDINIVDVRTGEIRRDQIVIIEKNRITAVGSRKETRYPRNAQMIISGRGSYLIPGLWDMHVHLVFGDWFPNAQQISLPLFVANGITSVRDMGSNLQTVEDWRNELKVAGCLVRGS
jgi:predicted amidohydrolase